MQDLIYTINLDTKTCTFEALGRSFIPIQVPVNATLFGDTTLGTSDVTLGGGIEVEIWQGKFTDPEGIVHLPPTSNTCSILLCLCTPWRLLWSGGDKRWVHPHQRYFHQWWDWDSWNFVSCKETMTLATPHVFDVIIRVFFCATAFQMWWGGFRTPMSLSHLETVPSCRHWSWFKYILNFYDETCHFLFYNWLTCAVYAALFLYALLVSGSELT